METFSAQNTIYYITTEFIVQTLITSGADHLRTGARPPVVFHRHYAPITRHTGPGGPHYRRGAGDADRGVRGGGAQCVCLG